MSPFSRVTIIGGGSGAFSAAVHLTQNSLQVTLCDVYADGKNIRPLLQEQRIHYMGVLGEGSVEVDRITMDMGAAVKDADLLMVCVPTTGHAGVARAVAPHLPAGIPILLNPGHSGGALNFRRALRDAGFSGRVLLGETNTLTYIARKKDSQTVNVTSVAKNVFVAALPASNLDALLEKTQALYPDLRPARTVLGTTLRNMNAIMHPPGMILGAAWIEHTDGDFYFYYDAATSAVEMLMQAIDDERLAIAAAWHEPIEPLIELLVMVGTTTPEARNSGSLQRAFVESAPNRFIKAPPSLDHRYMHEDIKHGLVPMAALGRAVSVETPIMDAIIQIASTINGIDYWQEGLNLANLGLAGMDRDQIVQYLARVTE